MRRREFVAAAGAALTFPTSVWGQVRERRIGVIMQIPQTDPEAQARLAALAEGLQTFGWAAGKNLRIEYRSASDPSQNTAAVADLLTTRPEVVLAVPAANAREVQRQSPATPLIFVNISDALIGGVVESLARPGRNTTGFASGERTTDAKRLELLKELFPSLRNVLVLANPNPGTQVAMSVLEEFASSMALRVSTAVVRDGPDIERAVAGFSEQNGAGLLAQPGGPVTAHRRLIIAAAAERRWPAMYGYRYYVMEGGLAAYGPSILDQWRRSSSYVHRILSGENTGDLPVQLPTKFELVLNASTARAIGVDLAPTLLARADEVIE